MTDAHEQDELPLSDALVRWTDPSLVASLRAEERRHTPYHLHEYYRIKQQHLQLCPDGALRTPSANSGWVDPPDWGGLLTAWRALERDVRLRIERGEFHLRGVRIAPARERTRSIIESAWAAEFEFDFRSGRVKVGDAVYVGVAATRGPAPEVAEAAVATPSSGTLGPVLPPITQETVRNLSDEEVLTLLEDHARRVVENDDYKALDPGITKVSFMPLILRKMQARAAAGEMLDTLRAEAAALAKWIHQKAPSHQTPTAATIGNSLRNEYSGLKA